MSSRKGKNVTTTAKRRAQPEPQSRQEGRPFDLPLQLNPKNFTRKSRHSIPGYQERKTMTAWCDYHSVFYNGLLNVRIEPTRTVDIEILREMGIDVSVARLIREMGLGTMPYADYDLYPDLVRQFLATCEVQGTSSVLDRRLYFFCNGVCYSIYVCEIGYIFKWETIRYDRKYNECTLNMMEDFWDTIGYGDFDPAELKIARIANPTLRIAAKILAHTFFCKEEPDRINKSALVLLFTGLSSELRTLLTSGAKPRIDKIDMSWMFADILVDRKYRGLGSSSDARIDCIGSLITPILKFAHVDLSQATVDTRRVSMDRAYLEHARIFKKGIYHWTTDRGAPSYCVLPCPTWTPTDTLEQLKFAVPGPEQCTADGRILPEYESNPEPMQAIYCDEPARFCQHGNPLPDPIPLATDFPDEFYDSIQPLPAGAPLDDWRGQRDRIQRQQTTILRGIVSALTHVQWAPPASCCSSAPEDAGERPE